MVQIDQLHFPYGKQIFRTEMRENTYVEPESIFRGKIKQMDTWLGNEHQHIKLLRRKQRRPSSSPPPLLYHAIPRAQVK